METLKVNLKIPLHIAYTTIQIFKFYLQGKKHTPPLGYSSLLTLFCYTGGWTNSLFARLITILNPPSVKPRPNSASVLSSDEIKEGVDGLRREGYKIFRSRLPDRVLDGIYEFGCTQPCRPRETDEELKKGQKNAFVERYPRSNPKNVVYDFDKENFLRSPFVQELIKDPNLLLIAQDYLQATPVLDVMALWWQTAASAAPDKEAAQFYHFDFDRIKWVKFFFYLTDVNENTGPHCFIRGSHRDGAIPRALLTRGYVRLTDEEVGQYFPQEDFLEMCGPRGTILAEDTRGLHKGKHVIQGDRLVLQIQFSNSLYGTNYPPLPLPPGFSLQ